MTPFDPSDPEYRRAPHDVYRRLREECPIHYSPAGYWVCTRYDDVKSLLTDSRFSSQYRGESPAATGVPVLDMTRRWFNFYDPPDHTRMRKLLSGFFATGSVEQFRQASEAAALALIDGVAARGEMDIVSGLAYPLPVYVMAEMLGVPRVDHGRLRPWLRALHASFDLDPSPEAVARGGDACRELLNYFAGLADGRRGGTADDLLGHLMAARETGEISAEELPATCILLLFAGYETTTNLISGGLAALLQHPDQLCRLWADPGLLPSAIEEMLRLVSPTQYVIRRALEDISLRGATIPRGSVVRLILAAANRDPAVFEDPDRLDIGRQPNKHLALGHGIHFCIGGPLSKLNATCVFRALMARFKHIELAGPAHTWGNVCLPGYESLRVRFVYAAPSERAAGE